MGGAAAVDIDHLAGDIGSIEDQEFHGACDVGRRADALQQGVVNDSVRASGGKSCVPWGHSIGARRHRIDPHPRPEFERQRAASARAGRPSPRNTADSP
jgi:hypothetical protein